MTNDSFEQRASLALVLCFLAQIRHIIPSPQNGLCGDDPCTLPLVTGERKAALKHLFKFEQRQRALTG